MRPLRRVAALLHSLAPLPRSNLTLTAEPAIALRALRPLDHALLAFHPLRPAATDDAVLATAALDEALASLART